MKITILAVLVSGMVYAQVTGVMQGVVTDPSGGAVKGAAVRLFHAQTGAERGYVTGADGYYAAAGLPPGTYEVRVQSPGFRPLSRRGVNLDAGRSLRIDVQLQLGEQTQSVVVEGRAPLVSVNAADWGSSVARERLEGLPLNGRDLFELAAREPGAAVSYTQQRSQFYGTALHMSVNGARPSQNGYRVDGIYVNDAAGSAPASSSGQTLGVEAVRELRLVSSPFLAEYGRAAGAIFTAVSKSGSNEFHGSLYEFLRNSALDAKNFFDSGAAPIPPLKRNQFGGLLSGPVLHNRLFFMGNYEGVRSVSSRTSIATTLGEAARAGKLPSGDVVVSAAAAPFLKLYPLPNGLLFSDGTGQFIAPLSTPAHENYATGKADYLPSQRLRFDMRWTFDRGGNTTPDPFLLWNFVSRSAYHFAHAGAQFIQSPATLHTFHAGFSRIDNLYTEAPVSPLLRDLSFVPGEMGVMTVTGLTDMGGQAMRSLPFRLTTNDYQLSWDVLHTSGARSLKAGAGFNRVQFNQRLSVDERGYYQFSGVSALLTAAPTSGTLLDPSTSSIRGWRQNLFSAFVQEEFRITRRLQLTAGVRYEPYSTPVEVNGLVAALPDPLHDLHPSTGIGLFRNPSHDNVAPRAALAWDMFGTGRTVFRAGAGIFYDMLSSRDVLLAGARMPPYYNRPQITRPPFPNLRAAASAPSGQSADGLQYYENQPYSVQMQAAVEHQWGQSTALRAGYAGHRGFHLPGYVGDVNVPRPAILPDGDFYFAPTAPLLNPAFQRITLRLTQFPSVAHALQLQASRQFSRGFRCDVKYSWAKVLDEMSNPTQNEFLNDDYMPFPLNYRLNRGPASFDLRHTFAADWSWQTRRVLGGWQLHGVLQAQSGLPFNPIVGFDRAGLRANTSGDLGQRPDFLGSAAGVIRGDPAQWFNPNAFGLPDANTYGNLGRNTLAGPALVNLDLAVHKILWTKEHSQVSLRVEMFNAANHPNFQIPSGLSLFSSNGARVGSAGQVTQTTTSSRQLQLALRASF